MDYMKLNPYVRNQINNILKNYHNSLINPQLTREIDFLDRTENILKSINVSSKLQSVSTRSKKIHSTPKVRFLRNPLQPSSNVTTELSDLLFVVKHFLNGKLVEHRALLGQIKFTSQKSKRWNIDTNQFFLMSQWPKFQIVSPARFVKSFHVKPKTRTWATYGFVGPLATKYPIYFSSSRILGMTGNIPTKKKFSFHPTPSYGIDSSSNFIIRLFQGSIGENLLANYSAMELISALYVLIGWKTDPPNELEWNSKEENEDGGLRIVEITVQSKGEYEQENKEFRKNG